MFGQSLALLEAAYDLAVNRGPQAIAAGADLLDHAAEVTGQVAAKCQDALKAAAAELRNIGGRVSQPTTAAAAPHADGFGALAAKCQAACAPKVGAAPGAGFAPGQVAMWVQMILQAIAAIQSARQQPQAA